ncbi:LPP20 family lipoprotein [Hydrogenimonas urashimensis]|uniref:LPP20 family lipoprotein n=1 Tax=Hydrogenimonas urashimensis TaxID=2740515 RepID=UPI001915EFC3|nr:LPP20 family lipoprotein [Hydrogenimonas urashimensis]
MKKIACFLFVALFFFGGCAEHTHQRAARKPLTAPVWYLNPPPNNREWLYGTGEGETMEEATRHALSNLLARIRVTVSSTYRSREYSHRDVYEHTFKESTYDIETTVEKVPVTHYETLRSERLAWNRYITQVGIHRDDFTKSLLKEVSGQIKEAEANWNAPNDASGLSRFKQAKRLKEMYEKILPELMILAALDPAYEPLYRNVTERKLFFIRKEKEAKEHLRFCIEPVRNSDFLPFAKTVAAALAQRGFALTQKPPCPNGALRVALDPTLSYDRIHGFYIVKGTVDLKLSNGGEKTVEEGMRYPIKGVSSKSRKAALLQASKSFEKSLEKRFFLP